MKLPPTRNHRQLAAWINARSLVDGDRRTVTAHLERIITNTDRSIPGTRLRHVGKGRQGLRLEIWPTGASRLNSDDCLYTHTSSETYRKHAEARAWVEQNLRPTKAIR